MYINPFGILLVFLFVLSLVCLAISRGQKNKYVYKVGRFFSFSILLAGFSFVILSASASLQNLSHDPLQDNVITAVLHLSDLKYGLFKGAITMSAFILCYISYFASFSLSARESLHFIS